jgi:hypothetical protein
MYYVGDGHCSFLRIFVCNKNNYHPEEDLAKFNWLKTKYELQIFNHPFIFLTTHIKSNIKMVIFIKFFLHL